jgi:hypothetical protein
LGYKHFLLKFMNLAVASGLRLCKGMQRSLIGMKKPHRVATMGFLILDLTAS